MPDPKSPSECCPGLQDKIQDWTTCLEKSVREEPVKAVGSAFAGGLLVAILPLHRIIGAFVRLALALVRPALLLLGLVKLFEEIDRRQK